MRKLRFFMLMVFAIIMLFVMAMAIPHHTVAAPPPVTPVPGGPTFQMLNAHQFTAYIPTVNGIFFNDELVNNESGSMFYQAALSIPNNITVTKMVVYFYDNTQADLVVALWRFDPATGDHVEMATVASADFLNQYRNAEDATIVDPTVDQQKYSYYVEVGMPPSGSALRVAAVRIDYGYTSSLPVVIKNP
jgi:hypothetical protein